MTAVIQTQTTPTEKEKKSLAEQLIHSLEIDGNPIVQMRKSDGFCNLTFMAKQAGKKTNDYMRMSSTKTFIEELKSNMENPENLTAGNHVVKILEVKEGRYGGTWGHPQLAINMAQWCSPKFAVAVSDLVMKFTTGQLTTTESREAAQLMQVQTEREQQQQPTTTVGPIRERTEDWYIVRELKQKSVHHQRQAAMKRRFPNAGRWQYIQWNVALSQAVTGYKPKQFSQKTGAPAAHRRSYYSLKQLHMLSIMDHTGIEFFENQEEMPTWKRVQEEFKMLCDETHKFNRRIKIHDGHHTAPPARPILSYKKAVALERPRIETGAMRRDQAIDRRVFGLGPERVMLC